MKPLYPLAKATTILFNDSVGGTKRLLILLLLVGSLAFAEEKTVYTLEWEGFTNGSGSRLILLTGFGPFADISDNPSGRIVQRLAGEIETRCSGDKVRVNSHVLPVVGGAIDRFQPRKFQSVLSIGVDANATEIRVEVAAHNNFEGIPIEESEPLDFVRRAGPLPADLQGMYEGFGVALGNETSAGYFVCNDTFYRSLMQNPKSYFVHIPNSPREEDENLSSALAAVACKIFTL